METYFKDYVDSFRQAKADRRKFIEQLIADDDAKQKAPVVARIEPGKKNEPTRDEVKRMIGTDEISEIERRVTTRKKKRA